MPTSETAAADSGTIMLFIRLWDEAAKSMTATVARHILKIGFNDADKSRMHELAEKNSDGIISPAELRELDNYVDVADLLGILQSKARIFPKNRAKAKASRV